MCTREMSPKGGSDGPVGAKVAATKCAHRACSFTELRQTRSERSALKNGLVTRELPIYGLHKNIVHSISGIGYGLMHTIIDFFLLKIGCCVSTKGSPKKRGNQRRSADKR